MLLMMDTLYVANSLTNTILAFNPFTGARLSNFISLSGLSTPYGLPAGAAHSLPATRVVTV